MFFHSDGVVYLPNSVRFPKPIVTTKDFWRPTSFINETIRFKQKSTVSAFV